MYTLYNRDRASIDSRKTFLAEMNLDTGMTLINLHIFMVVRDYIRYQFLRIGLQNSFQKYCVFDKCPKIYFPIKKIDRMNQKMECYSVREKSVSHYVINCI